MNTKNEGKDMKEEEDREKGGKTSSSLLKTYIMKAIIEMRDKITNKEDISYPSETVFTLNSTSTEQRGLVQRTKMKSTGLPYIGESLAYEHQYKTKHGADGDSLAGLLEPSIPTLGVGMDGGGFGSGHMCAQIAQTEDNQPKTPLTYAVSEEGSALCFRTPGDVNNLCPPVEKRGSDPNKGSDQQASRVLTSELKRFGVVWGIEKAL